MWKSADRAPVFASFTLAFALQLRKKHGKTSVRVRKTSASMLLKTSNKSSECSGLAELTGFLPPTMILPNVFHVLHTINLRLNKKGGRNAFKSKLITCLMRAGCCVRTRSCNTAQTPLFPST